MSKITFRAVGATFMVLVSLVAYAPEAKADNISEQNRLGAFLPGYYSSGSAIDGVAGTLRVIDKGPGPTADDIFMYVESDGTFIQLGIKQGLTRFNGCNGQLVNLTWPHFFIGAQRPGDQCETLRDLGPFGSVNNYRQFGLRRNPDGTYYATLDNEVRYTTSVTFPAAMRASVVAEANTTCAYLYTKAETASSPYKSLKWHDNARSWQYWTEQYNYESGMHHRSLYLSGRRNGAPTFYAFGPSPYPSWC